MKHFIFGLGLALAIPAALAQLRMPAQKPPPGEVSRPAGFAQQQAPDPAVVERMFGCLAPGLPKDWKKTWVTVTAETPGEVPGKFQIKTFYAENMADKEGKPLKPCGWDPFVEGFYELNQSLAEDRRAWKTARLTITSEGKFELTYDYEAKK
jgi:hypothetical protein